MAWGKKSLNADLHFIAKPVLPEGSEMPAYSE